jgi:hypothetical protein
MPSPTHGVAGQLDPYGEINRKLAEMQRQIDQLRAAPRAQATTIGDGGLVVTGDGGVSVIDSFENILFAFGALSDPLPGGVTQYGLLVYRQHADGTPGSLAVSMYAGTGVQPQTVGLWDDAGNALWTDDGVAGQGIGRPYLSFPVAPFNSALWPATSASSWAKLIIAAPPKQHPKVVFKGAAVTPAGVTGQLRLWDANTGTQVGSTVTVAGQPAGVNWQIGPDVLSGAHMDTMQLELQGQITAGAGSISATVYAAYGCQS